MAFMVKVPTNVYSQGKFGACLNGGGMKQNGVFSVRRSVVSVSAAMSSTPAQNVENLSIKSKDIGLPIMVEPSILFVC